MTGVLPIALGRATRIVQTLLTAGKEYVAIMHLHKDVDENVLRETINKHFVGKIQQIPPLKSSVKRQLRTRTVYYFDILEIDGKDILFMTHDDKDIHESYDLGVWVNTPYFASAMENMLNHVWNKLEKV